LKLADNALLDVEIDVGSGSIALEIGEAVDASMRVDGGSGRLTIDAPVAAAVRVDVRDSGSGRVIVPDQLEQTRRGEDDEGTWETPDWSSASNRIEVVVEDLGSGTVEVR
jgi:hypothetical protein